MGEAAKNLQHASYEEVYSAVVQTERGRWFLEEFAARNKAADTTTILERLQQIQQAEEDSRMNLIRGELGELADTIAKTRDEIAAIQPKDDAQQGKGKANSADRIEAATGELDAIVSATEQATSDILSAAENLQNLSEEMRNAGVDGAFCEPLETESINILMACSFQDITGQRTSKVVNTLRYLEQRVNAMVQIWGTEKAAKPSIAADQYNPTDTRPDAHLLHGPSMGADAVDQSLVDQMMDGELPDLDDLVVTDAAPEDTAPVSQSDESPTSPPDDNEVSVVDAEEDSAEISQDDIDSLFD